MGFLGALSYLAIKTIILNEVKNFFVEFQYNIIAPFFNTAIFIFILSTINKYYVFSNFEGSYINFLIPGIIIAVVMQTSFGHLAKVIINMKQIGSFNDYLISPISRSEIFLSFIISSLIVCLTVGFINIILLSFFSDFKNINYFSIFYYLTVTILIFSSIGAVVGFLSFTWDIESSVSNFFIVPISLLSGTFFSIDSLDKNWHFLFKYNPFYYLVDGFRSSFIINFKISIYNEIYICTVLIFSILISILVFRKGYRVIG